MSTLSPGYDRWRMTRAHRRVINRARTLVRKVNAGASAHSYADELLGLVDAVGCLLDQERRESTRRPCEQPESQCDGEVRHGEWCETLTY